MSQNAVKRLYLMQVGSMPEYQIPIVCYLVQTGDSKHILIDSGLPEIMPEGESDFENGKDVIEQLASIGLKPDDIDTVISTHYDGDHAGRHAAFTKAHYVVQRVHHLDAASNPRYAAIRPQWDQPIERLLKRGTPATAMEGFKPHARPVVEMRDRAMQLGVAVMVVCRNWSTTFSHSPRPASRRPHRAP